jgi:hypothetical protein
VTTTFLTIGFGDITPITLSEMVFTVILQISGVTLQCVIASNLVAILMDTDFSEYTQEYKLMQRYLRFWKVEDRHRHAMREYAQYQWERMRGAVNLTSLLLGLPVRIRRSVQFEMTREHFSNSPTFQGLGPRHLMHITDALMFRNFSPGEILYRQGDPATHMFFCRSGIVSIIVDGQVVATQPCEGNLHCEYECVTGGANSCTAKAVTYADAWVYRMKDFVSLLARKSDIRLLVLERFSAMAPDQFDDILAVLVPDSELRRTAMDFQRKRGIKLLNVRPKKPGLSTE